jgi:hypothetical protein
MRVEYSAGRAACLDERPIAMDAVGVDIQLRSAIWLNTLVTNPARPARFSSVEPAAA